MYSVSISSNYEDLTYGCLQHFAYESIDTACQALVNLTHKNTKELIPFCFKKDSEEIQDYISELPIDAYILAFLADEGTFENCGYMSSGEHYVSATLGYSILEDWKIKFNENWDISINNEALINNPVLLKEINKYFCQTSNS